MKGEHRGVHDSNMTFPKLNLDLACLAVDEPVSRRRRRHRRRRRRVDRLSYMGLEWL